MTDILDEIDALKSETRDPVTLATLDRVAGQVTLLRCAAHSLLKDVEACARDSFATSAETFEQDWRTEDPKGFAAWYVLHVLVDVPGASPERDT